MFLESANIILYNKLTSDIDFLNWDETKLVIIARNIFFPKE